METTFLKINNLRYRVLQWNSDANGQAVIFLHGLASNARIWELVAPMLADGSLRLSAPDMRGHGLSDKPDDYSFEAITQDLHSLIEELGLVNPILIGHSWGASLVLNYSANYSSGMNSPSGIVLIDGGMVQMNKIPGATWESVRQRLEPPKLAGTPLAEFTTRLKDWNSKWGATDKENDIYLANFEINENNQIFPHLTYERHMLIVRAMWEFETHQTFQDLDCPVLMIPANPPHPHDERMKSFLDAKTFGVQVAQNSISNLQVHWMEDTIHDIPLQRPKELAELVSQFIKSI